MCETYSNLYCPNCREIMGFECSGSGNSGNCTKCEFAFTGRFSRALMDKRTKEKKHADGFHALYDVIRPDKFDLL